VKAVPRHGKREPGGGEAQEGRGSVGALTGNGRHRTQRGEQSPEGEGVFAGHRRVRSTARGHDKAGETRYGSAVRDKPL
jgi:hypothetical protein